MAHPDYDDVEDLEEYIIDASDPFDASHLFGYCDGDYPRWMQNMVEDLPASFVEEFGTYVTSFISGSCTQYPLNRVREMEAVLKEYGYDLILLADYR